jgi:pimeloyl-ACP methyl ester carboxylesterase
MKALRTPDENFKNLPGFSFKPNYVDRLPSYEDLRMHYVDEGPRQSEHVFLCLHGQPTWSYLYRKMIPVFVAAGNRAIAPDFFGFGRSDKPVEDEIYTFDFHRNSLIEFIQYLDLQNITLVCQDWGGVLGLTLPMEMPERFSRLLIMNTALSTGDIPLTKGFLDWRKWNNEHPDMGIGRLIGRACPHLSAEELATYDAPFPDIRYKAGVRRFPNLVPDRPDAPGAETSRKAREWLKNEWSGLSFMAVGMQDPVLGLPVMRMLQKIIRGCPKPYKLKEAGHFVQEWGEVVAKKAIEEFQES